MYLALRKCKNDCKIPNITPGADICPLKPDIARFSIGFRLKHKHKPKNIKTLHSSYAYACANVAIVSSEGMLELHCASLLLTIYASSARAHERVHVQIVRDFPQTKPDNVINSLFS